MAYFRKTLRIDTTLSLLLGMLIVGGALIFSSAALGVLAKGSAPVSSIMLNHIGLGIGLGLILLIAAFFIHYRNWRRLAPWLFGIAAFFTALVFIPHIGLSHGGARRWILIGPFSLQPAELLKLTTIMLSAAYFSTFRSKLDQWSYGFGGFLGLIAIPSLLLLMQPDTGTLGIIITSVFAMFFVAGARWQHIAAMLLAGICVLGLLAFTRPYVMDRIMTLINPSNDPLVSSYQIRQSFIAIGSGGVFGRGFGQSVQKYSYLPEPVGDSIFAVAGEEFGFVGGFVLVSLFLALALRSFRVATRAPDLFGGLLAVGISTYLAGEAFINIASMVGLMPLTGIPLTFISQGGTAMLVALTSAGVLLNISRNSSKSH